MTEKQQDQSDALTPSGSPLRGARAFGLVLALTIAFAATQLNTTMISPVLPAIAEGFRVGIDQASQVSSLLYLVGGISGAVFVRWSDFFGRHRTLVFLAAVNVAGSVVSLLAPTLPMLLVGRALNGVGGGVFAIAFVLINESLTRRAFGLSLGILSAVTGGIGGVDGYLGGLIAETWGFRWIFGILLIAGLLSLVLLAVLVPADGARASAGRMDWWGAGLLSVGLISLNTYIAQGSADGWAAPFSLALLGLFLAACVALVIVERRVSTPLIPVTSFRSRSVWPVLAAGLLVSAGAGGLMNLTMIVFAEAPEAGYGMSASTAALMFVMPPAFIGLAAATATGVLGVAFGWRRSMLVAVITTIAAMVVLTVFANNSWLAFVMMALLGAAYSGAFLTTMNGLAVTHSPADAPGMLPGLNIAAYAVGVSSGIALQSALLADGSSAAYLTAFIVATALSAVGLVAALTLRAPRTMNPPRAHAAPQTGSFA